MKHVAFALALSATWATAAAAQRTHVLIITGLAGEPRFAESFHGAARTIHDVARDQWKVSAANLVWLAADSARDAQRVDARASRESVGNAFVAMSQRVDAGDLVLVVLIGHGSGEGAASRINLPGPDPTAADFNGWIAGLARQTVVVVNASSGSGDFLGVLRGPNRVIVTATRSSFERNASVFADFFALGIGNAEADADKDGRFTVRETFDYATREVARSYESAGTMQSEHAAISDTALAARVSFGPPIAGADDPRVRALLGERRLLEEQVNVLRARRSAMPAAEYETELERLLLAIAEKNAAIRAAGGRP